MKDYPFLANALSIVIEKLRRERKLSKSALADFACLDRRYLKIIEDRQKRPTLNAILAICDALNIHPADFIRMVTDEMERQHACLARQQKESQKYISTHN